MSDNTIRAKDAIAAAVYRCREWARDDELCPLLADHLIDDLARAVSGDTQ